jgi:predicted GIY-YIG superfamily endonuclease
MSHYCYILANDRDQATYNGYTTHLERRLRQHNGELKGGAKFTTRRSCRGCRWRYLVTVTCDDPAFDKRTALSLEWHIRYPTNHRPRPAEFSGASGRLRGLALALQNPKFSAYTFCIDPPDALLSVRSSQ